MDTNKLKAEARKHAPTAGIAIAAAVLAAQLAAPDAPTQTLKLPPEVERVEASKPPASGPMRETRLVSCGNSKQATLAGNDDAGAVALGEGAAGRCTVLFARRGERVCNVEGGRVVSVNGTDLVVATDAAAFTYRCGGPK